MINLVIRPFEPPLNKRSRIDPLNRSPDVKTMLLRTAAAAAFLDAGHVRVAAIFFFSPET